GEQLLHRLRYVQTTGSQARQLGMWLLPTHQGMYDSTARVQIAPGLRAAQPLFNGRIAWGARGRLSAHCREPARDAEVDDLGPVRRGLDHDIGWLQVATDEGRVLPMKIGQRLAEAHAPLCGLAPIDLSILVKHLFERLTRDEVHG